MTTAVADALFVCFMAGAACLVVGAPLFLWSADLFDEGAQRTGARIAGAVLIALGAVFEGMLIAWHLTNLFNAWPA